MLSNVLCGLTFFLPCLCFLSRRSVCLCTHNTQPRTTPLSHSIHCLYRTITAFSLCPTMARTRGAKTPTKAIKAAGASKETEEEQPATTTSTEAEAPAEASAAPSKKREREEETGAAEEAAEGNKKAAVEEEVSARTIGDG